MRKNLSLMSVFVMFVLSLVSVSPVLADAPVIELPSDYCTVSAEPYITAFEGRNTDGSLVSTGSVAMLWSSSGSVVPDGTDKVLVVDWSSFSADYPGIVGSEEYLSAVFDVASNDGNNYYESMSLGWRTDRRQGNWNVVTSWRTLVFPTVVDVSLTGFHNPLFRASSHTVVKNVQIALPCNLVPTPTPTLQPSPTPTAAVGNSLTCNEQSIVVPHNLDNVQFTIPSGYSVAQIIGETGASGGYVTGDLSANFPHSSPFNWSAGIPQSGGVSTLIGDFVVDTQIGFCNPAVGTPVPTVAPTFTPDVRYTPTPDVIPTATPFTGGGGWSLPTPMPMGDAYSFSNSNALEFLSFFVTFLHAMNIYWPIVISMMLVLAISVVSFFLKRYS